MKKTIYYTLFLFLGLLVTLAIFGYVNKPEPPDSAQGVETRNEQQDGMAGRPDEGSAHVFNISNNTNISNPSDMNSPTDKKQSNPYYSRTDKSKLSVSDAEWKRVLLNDLYEVSRKKGTERSFTGKYWDYTGKGTYYCAACGNLLFRSDAKFASECGWPSFFEQSDPKSVVFHEDHSFGMDRTEASAAAAADILGTCLTMDLSLPGNAIA